MGMIGKLIVFSVHSLQILKTGMISLKTGMTPPVKRYDPSPKMDGSPHKSLNYNYFNFLL